MASVTVWNEFVHEREDDAVEEVYPDGIHETVAGALADHGHETRTATLQEDQHGLTDDVLDETDVLFWWGHTAHEEVDDAVVERVCDRVHEGMGFVALHSGHFSKPFKRLMGTPCSLTWRENEERERLWAIHPEHPIVEGIDSPVVVPEAETYGEPFAVPEPDELVFTSWFEGGEVFRSGCCYRRGLGRVFYFRPGHETHPIYHDETIQQILANAAEWASENADTTADLDTENVAEPPEAAYQD
jgi:trehalose utilization protein